ncbi:MAG: CDP-glucose 4,6-dehydratase [Candidatus Micrarchaeia archaeon]
MTALNISNFYNHKKVLITGHTGFIGSWLTKWLLMSDAYILGYSLGPPTEPNMYNTINISKNIKDMRKDIRDRQSLSNAISKFQPQIVFHLAAQPIVLKSYDSPIETFDTNVIGTVNLLDSLRKIDSVKVIIVMTSDKVYKNNEWIYSYREIDPLGGKDPYSASKSCQDIIVNSFRESYFTDKQVGVSSIRAGNVIGGGDWGKHRIVPDIVRGITKNKIIKIRNPEAIRPWQHVLEPVSGMLELAEKMWNDINFSGDWNFGPNNQGEITVKELADKFIKIWGSGRYSIIKDKKVKEVNYLKLDINKAKSKLKWLPHYNFDETVKKTVEWYKEYYKDKSNINKITENQIKTYAEGVKDE